MKEGQVKQDCDEIGARQGRDSRETLARQGRHSARQGRDSARQGRDRGETARDTRETGARHWQDMGETLARQEGDMTEDVNMNIYFIFLTLKNSYILKKYLYNNITTFILSKKKLLQTAKTLGSRLFFGQTLESFDGLIQPFLLSWRVVLKNSASIFGASPDPPEVFRRLEYPLLDFCWWWRRDRSRGLRS